MQEISDDGEQQAGEHNNRPAWTRTRTTQAAATLRDDQGSTLTMLMGVTGTLVANDWTGNPMNTCRNCGSEVGVGVANCVACGTAVSHGVLAPPQPPPPPSGGDWRQPPTDAPAGTVGVTPDDRNWAMVAHLSGLVSAGLGGLIFIGPLVLWLIKKDDSRYLAHHTSEALNFNLSMALYTVLSFVVALTIIGIIVAIPALLIGSVAWFVCSIVAAVKAYQGESFRYPLTIRFLTD